MIELDEGSSISSEVFPYSLYRDLKIESVKDGKERFLHITGIEGRSIDFITKEVEI